MKYSQNPLWNTLIEGPLRWQRSAQEGRSRCQAQAAKRDAPAGTAGEAPGDDFDPTPSFPLFPSICCAEVPPYTVILVRLSIGDILRLASSAWL